MNQRCAIVHVLPDHLRRGREHAYLLGNPELGLFSQLDVDQVG